MKTSDTVVDDARLMIVRLDPERQIERVGHKLVIHLVRLSYNLVRLQVTAELRGADELGRVRNVTIRNWKEFPDWLQEMSNRYTPDGFHDPSLKKRAERIARREKFIRGATPKNQHPDMITE